MPRLERFDYSEFTAKKTDEGFLIDSPVISRTGIQEYKRADGTVVRELRLPEDVFNVDSLESMRAKPITVDHPDGKVSSKTAHRVTVGTLLTAGRQDGDHVRADIVIHSPDTIGERRELSLGYTCILDEAPGEWNGQKYDAIQRDIKINHLSVVKRGRAGVARLNIDSNEIINQQENKRMALVKVKLGNGIEYDAEQEVFAELSKLRADSLVSLDAVAKIEAERDTLQAKIDAHADGLLMASALGRANALERIKLEASAEKFKVDHAGKTDREIKEAVIRSVRKDADLSEKSDAYIDAAYDITNEIKADVMAGQRQSANTKNDELPSTAKTAYQKYMADLSSIKESA